MDFLVSPGRAYTALVPLQNWLLFLLLLLWGAAAQGKLMGWKQDIFDQCIFLDLSNMGRRLLTLLSVNFHFISWPVTGRHRPSTHAISGWGIYLKYE